MRKIKRLLALLSAAAVLAGMIAASASVALANGSFTWGGQGYPNPTCSASSTTMLWIFNPHSAAVPTSLTINGVAATPVAPTIGGWTNSGGGQNWHFTAAITATNFPPTSATVDYTGTIGNNAILTLSGCDEGGTNPPAADLAVVKSASGSYDNKYAWTIKKTADNATVYTAGGKDGTADYTIKVSHDGGTISNVQVTGTISVLNPNTAPVAMTEVTDQLSDGTVCDVTGGGAQTLDVGITDFLYSCSTTSAPAALNNTATVSWDAQTLSNGEALAASSASFTVTGVTFTETTIDNCVDVTDGTIDLGTVCVGDANPTSFAFTGTVSGGAGTCTNNDNTATFTTNTTNTTGSSSASVDDCQGADLTVTKTATPAFERTYNWTISKSVDKTKVTTSASTATFNYTVGASETGFSDSGWQVTGKITITNPNDWEDVTLTSLTDAVDNGGSCTVGAGPYTVPKGSSIDVGYTCTYASAPSAASGTNTATATWDAGTYSTPTGTASGDATFSFTTPTSTVNKTVTITDTFNGSTTTLGTLTATDSTPYTSATYTYSRTVSVPRNGCFTYNNTATIVETDQTAGASVQVCGPVTGGLTMGFWQNKNGQGIIKSYCGGTSGTSLAAYLEGFAPFQDFSGTSCSDVASYVYTVIKAANASGASMNAMLKAQDLATTLDVYFSTPNLGGNRIGAPTPLGPVYVDLASICKMIDGSGGGTCSGNLENTAAAFGGSPTCQQISALLTEAASQSDEGGITWYGNVKATQGLAKDTFDAINNGVAYSCTPTP